MALRFLCPPALKLEVGSISEDSESKPRRQVPRLVITSVLVTGTVTVTGFLLEALQALVPQLSTFGDVHRRGSGVKL